METTVPHLDRLRRVLDWLAPAIALAALATSCRSVEGTRGLPPFFEIYDSPSSPNRRSVPRSPSTWG